MLTCPVCSRPVAEDAAECPSCHLAAGLFEPVREAVGSPRSDPEYLEEMGELVAALETAVGDDPVGERPRASAFAVAQPGRFLAPPAPRGPTEERPMLRREPGLPALPPGNGPELWRRQADDYLRLARRRGMDVTEFNARSRMAIEADDPASLEVLSRDLFVHLAAGLTEDLESLHARREELLQWSTTPSLDAELAGAESALAMGDLIGADRRIRRLTDEIGRLTDQWATIQILYTEAELLKETLTDLGGNPAPAQGPLDEGVRLAHAGRRADAEKILAHANLALWSLLAPRLTHDLSRLKELLVRRQADGLDVGDAAMELREIATCLRRHNFGSLVAAYRRLRSILEAPPVGPVRSAVSTSEGVP